MKQNQVVVAAPFPILTVLGIVFIVLKLTNVITWSWWWVLSPFWIPFAALLSLWIIFFAAYLVFGRR